MYNNKVLEIFNNPKNIGEMRGANGSATIGSEAEGNILKLFLKINDDEIIEDAGFKTCGTTATIVCCSVLTEMVKGLKVEEALLFDEKKIVAFVGGLPKSASESLTLVKEVLILAINNYKKRKLRAKMRALKLAKNRKVN